MKDENSSSAENAPAHPAEDASEKTADQNGRKTPQKKGSRGPSAGRYQNGRACFSAWYDGEFLVRLRRYALKLGFPGVAELVKSDYSMRVADIVLTPEDLAEIEAVRQSVRKPVPPPSEKDGSEEGD
ncbi:MAG: hypothetical protein MJZ81_07185 [Bacteroidales bacterium]|nr:hypothetical protein [Bacteroidales bacterium]